jgi:hypothetical protein
MTETLSATPISPLRQRLNHITMRHFAMATKRNYIRDIGRFATFLGRAFDTAVTDDLRRFQIEQREVGVPVHPLYTNIATRTVRTVTSPLDELGIFTPGEVMRRLRRACLNRGRRYLSCDRSRCRAVQAGHLSLIQLKMMSVTEHCHITALGGHVEACDDYGNGASPRTAAATALSKILTFSGTMADLEKRQVFMRDLSPVRRKR